MTSQVDQAIARDRVIRLKLQKEIWKKYPEKLVENQERLCKSCKFGSKIGHCRHDILPVTSDGKDCFYWSSDD